MNCNDFETKITDLARDQRMDVAARDQAMAHAAGCQHCAARLRDEQKLTAGLRQLAATFSDAQMPERGEAQLLAALRAARTAASEPKRTRQRHWLRWAAAAVIIALMGVAAVRFIEWRKSQPQKSPQAGNLVPVPVPNVKEPEMPDMRVAVPHQPEMVMPHHVGYTPRIATHKMASKVASHKNPTIPDASANTVATQANDPADAQADEITTSFIPLVEGRGFAPIENLQLVRVELPRSALVTFGLPMNVERVDERIKADLLVGNDGIARAIRFVR